MRGEKRTERWTFIFEMRSSSLSGHNLINFFILFCKYNHHHHRSSLDGMLEAAVTNFLQASLSNMSCWTSLGSRSRSLWDAVRTQDRWWLVVSCHRMNGLHLESRKAHGRPVDRKYKMAVCAPIQGWKKCFVPGKGVVIFWWDNMAVKQPSRHKVVQGGAWGGMWPPRKLNIFEKWHPKWCDLVHHLFHI